ncbi:MAG: DUF4440 domain-containing protein [Ignavibacteriae bacterium]|nr:DUF4440 domain-containing protein [Ignavibacteriota bacterium]
MTKHFCFTVLIGCCLAMLVLGCTPQQPDTRAKDEAAIRDADIGWSKVAETNQVDQMIAYFLEDAVVLAPNEPMASGKEAIGTMLRGFFAMPGFSVKWQPTKVEVSRSGDLGYSLGTYEMTMNDPKGIPMTDRGKYATVWKKQADGSWKVAADMFNSDLPLPQLPSQ